MNVIKSVEKTKTLRDFLNEEMHRRNLSIREFATMADLSHTVISRAVDETDPKVPSYQSLLKIARATGVDAVTIIKLTEDNVPDIDVEARILAQQINRLAPDDRRHIMATIRGHLQEVDKHKND